MLVNVAILVFGVFACSTAVIMIKACTVPPTLLAAYRLFVAAAVLTIPAIDDVTVTLTAKSGR